MSDDKETQRESATDDTQGNEETKPRFPTDEDLISWGLL